VSLISPYVINREDARNIIDKRNFIELYIKCSLKTCEYRDVKFMYSRARNGQIKNFTGITDVYEPLNSPDLILNTDTLSLEKCIAYLLNFLEEKKFV
jgi:adenylylsulfate kinase